MTMPGGLVRLWHSSKFWMALIGFVSAIFPDLAQLLVQALHILPYDPATWPHLVNTVRVAGPVLGGVVISVTGLEDSLRKFGITTPLANEAPIGNPAPPKTP